MISIIRITAKVKHDEKLSLEDFVTTDLLSNSEVECLDILKLEDSLKDPEDNKEFFWQDLSGRDFNATFTTMECINAFEDGSGEELSDGDVHIREFVTDAEVGDEWVNRTNKVTRIK